MSSNKHIRGIARCFRATRLIGSISTEENAIFIRNTRSRIFLLENDNRARRLVAERGVTQPYVTWLWSAFSKELEPTLLIDVGANYGEVSLTTRYSKNASILLVEANPVLAELLEKSARSRKDRSQFTVVNRYVGESGKVVSFSIDQKWSGTSSGVNEVVDTTFKGAGDLEVHHEELVSSSLDSIVARMGRLRRPRSLLVKIDIEGAEHSALENFKETLSYCEEFTLIVEYTSGAATSRNLNKEYLSSIGKCLYWPRGGTAVDFDFERSKKSDVVIVSEAAALKLRSLKRPFWV